MQQPPSDLQVVLASFQRNLASLSSTSKKTTSQILPPSLSLLSLLPPEWPLIIPTIHIGSNRSGLKLVFCCLEYTSLSNKVYSLCIHIFSPHGFVSHVFMPHTVPGRVAWCLRSWAPESGYEFQLCHVLAGRP